MTRRRCARRKWNRCFDGDRRRESGGRRRADRAGLSGIVACISEGRSAFQRVLTYTLTILVNKCVTLIVLGAGLMITGHAVLTPLLQAISMLTGDFVTMARAADRAAPSAYPNAWRVRNLSLAAVPLGLFRLLYLVAVLGVGWFWLRLNPGEMQTMTFTMLAFAGKGMSTSCASTAIFGVRVRRRSCCWPPSATSRWSPLSPRGAS